MSALGPQPSRRSDVEPFHVMEVLAAAAERQRTHGDVISLCAGQPSTGAPQAARDAAVAAIEADALGYTETVGIRPLREAIAAYHRDLGVDGVSAEDVVVTTGSSGAFTLLFLAAFDDGDEVWMTRPGYPAYRNTLRALGADVVELACGAEVRYQPTVAMLEAERATRGAAPRGLVVASPANPTGTIIDPDELAAVARWCDEHGVLLVSDEIYHGISFGRPCASAWQTSRNGVVIGSVSKFFSMTGWRVGWVLVPTHLRRRVAILASNLTICPPAVSQHAALAALGEAARAELEGHVETYRRNRELVERRLPEIGVTTYAPPDGAFYAWCDVSHLTDDSTRWCAEVLAATGVAITPGIDFDPVDGHRFMRMSLAVTTTELDEAFDRLVRYTRACGDAPGRSIRSATRGDWPAMVDVWRVAVEATHDFLTAEDIAGIEAQLISAYFPAVDLVVAEGDDAIEGFAGVHEHSLEMLFVDSDHHGRGVGTALLDAVDARFGIDRVDVNEQNPSAAQFYLRRGFVIVGRSDTDEAGRPFPLLHLRADRDGGEGEASATS